MKRSWIIFVGILLLLPAALSACPGCSFGWNVQVRPEYLVWKYVLFAGIFLTPFILYACGVRIIRLHTKSRKYIWTDTILLTLFWIFSLGLGISGTYGAFLAFIFFLIPNIIFLLLFAFLGPLFNSGLGPVVFIIVIATVAGLFYLISRCLNCFRVVWKYSKTKISEDKEKVNDPSGNESQNDKKQQAEMYPISVLDAHASAKAWKLCSNDGVSPSPRYGMVNGETPSLLLQHAQDSVS